MDDTATRSTSLASLERRVHRPTVGHRLLRWSAVVVACLVIGTIAPASAAPLGPAADPVPAQSSSPESSGAGSGEAGISAGELLVADFNGLDSIERIALDGTANGTLDEAGGLVGAARAVEVGPDGLVYVAGADTGRVVRYDPADGSLAGVVVDTDAGLDNPRALAFDGDGNLLVASSGTDEIVSFDPDTGERLGVVAADRLDNPGGMLVADGGLLWVTSQNTDSIIGYSAGGEIQAEIETGPGSGPVDVTVGPGGVFFVAMADSGRVDVVTLPVERVGLPEIDAVVEPFIDDGLVTPTAVTIGPDGALWVADHWSGTIRRFDATTGAELGFEAGPADGSAEPQTTDRSLDASYGPTDIAFLVVVAEAGDVDPTTSGGRSTRARNFVATEPTDRAFAASGRDYDAVVRADSATLLTTGGEEIVVRMNGAAADKPGRLIAGSRRGEPVRTEMSDPWYDDVWFDDVLGGVDLVWTSDGSELEYSFVIPPGASPDTITLDFGADVGVWVDGDGNAVLGDTGLLSTAPVTYQDTADGRIDVASRYLFRPDGTVGFHVEDYDPTLPLIIDPTFRASASATSGGGNSITISRPAGVTADDVLLASIAQSKNLAITPPAGWTVIRSDTQESKVWQDLFYKVATGSEPASYVFSLSGDGKSAGAIVAYDGVDTTNPIDAHGGQGNPVSTSYTAPSITTTTPGVTLVAFFGNEKASNTTPPAGMTERADQASGEGATAIADEVLGAAGSTGTRTATGSSAVNVGQLVALRPAAPPSGLWMSTITDVASPSGAPGLDSWSAGALLTFGDPGLAFEPTATAGTFSLLTDLDAQGQDGTVVLVGLDVVENTTTVGTSPPVVLQPGDLLLSTKDDEIWVNADTSTTSSRTEDVIRFQPATPGDYSSGTFTVLLDAVLAGLNDVSLVEQAVTVGDTLLPPGSLLLTTGDQLHHITPTGTGPGNPPGVTTLLVDGPDVGLNQNLIGLHLVDDAVQFDGVDLTVGDLLVSLGNEDPTAGDNSISVARHDVFLLELTRTTSGSGVAAGDATAFFDGSDVGLNVNDENVSGVALVGGTPITAPRANDDQIRTRRNGGVTVVPMANDLDPNADPLSIQSITQPANGVAVDNGDGTVTYTPDTGYVGSDSFTYTITDGTETDTATVNVDTRAPELWFSTIDPVVASGTAGLTSWTAGQVLSLGGPGFTLDPPTTSATVGSVLELDGFADDGVATIGGLHEMTTALTIGSGGNSFDLQPYDLVLVSDSSDTFVGRTTSITVSDSDVFVFRPDAPGDPTSTGEFYFLLENPVSAGVARSMSVVEQTTPIGDTTFTAGTFLFSHSSGTKEVWTYTVDATGLGTTAGTLTSVIDMSDEGMGGTIDGLEFLEEATTIGGRSLGAGTLLMTLDGETTVAGTAVQRWDVFAVDVATTTLVAGITSATTSIVFDGSDTFFDANPESLYSLYLSAELEPPSITATVNSTGDAADATPGDDVCDTGATNSEGDPECTLRAAIEEANMAAGATIDFAIPISDPGYSASPLSYTLAPATPYPLITAPIVLDATTQAGYSGDPIVELDGTGAVGASGGLILRTDDSTIRGFAVHSFVDEGLEIDGSTGFGDNNTLQNNWVGLDVAGTVRGNGDHGILVTVDALDNLIGGTGATDGNVVAGSTSIGVLIRTNSTGNAVLGNSVYANGGLGLDLDEDGVTANDAGDPDTGSNDLLNFPSISSAVESGGTVTVTFDLDVPANPDGYRVEFFTNPAGADPSGNGEGEQFASAVTVSPGTGLTHDFAGSIGEVITATATVVDAGTTSGYRSTSEYSPAVTVTDGIGVPTTTVTFRQGANGYTGTVDTWISSNVPSQDNSADVLLQIDDSPVQHGLIRFDGIIGPGVDQIPAGATIVSADLTFEAADPSAADASLSLYRVLRSWVETDTWNSLSSGISTDNVEANSVPDAVHTGGLDLTNTPITIAGLEAAVQAWVDGDANQGWLLTLNRTNGWDAQSSENADAAGRPTLEVTYVVGPVTHVVNSTGNGTDANPGDAVCDTGATNSAGDPECTLRAAITEANAFPTVDVINFAMPATEAGHSAGVWTITPGSALPNLSDEVTIDGSTQTGWTTTPVVELNGASAGGSTDGFRITADNVTIRSLAINRFGADGIELVSGAANALIAGNHIGVDPSGTIDRGNGGRGIDLGSGSGPTTVGGTTAADRNVISGNGGDGIIVWNSDNNVIIGNHLGTDVTGNAPLANDADGVAMGSGSAGNIIGQPGAGNVLSGNVNDGFENDAVGPNNVVQANIIGLGADGDTLVPNGRYGVVIYNGANNTTIGGGGAGEGNVISGNVQSGAIIDGAGNPATTGNVIAGNLIGTDATGLLERGNGTYGIHFFATAAGNTIGGPTAADGNVISGNGSGQAGIYITGTTSGANVIQHNFVGVNSTGTAAIPNNLHGIWINEAPNTQILDNLISGNDVHGVYVSGVGATGTQILRNTIGTNAAQTATIPNLFDGVRLEGGSSATTVGTPGNGNVIGGNADHGVNINSSNGNTIQGNYIGTNSGGSVDLGNTDAGVYSDAFGSSNNTIGGATLGDGNVIAFNGVGIQLDTGDDNAILRNSVYANVGLGIDLGGAGVSLNDSGDGDAGSNDLLNFPVVLPPIGGVANVAIDLDVPAGDYRIEIFANPTDGADASGHGEGETHLGAATVTHAGSGVERFNVPLVSAVAENDVVAATTTEDLGGGSYGSTSEFSAAVTVGPAALTVNSTGDDADSNPGDGYCHTGGVNSEGDPECTLRAVIEEVNALGVFNVDTDFAIPTSDPGYTTTPRPHWTIAPATPLPAITAYHDIDATTQAGWAALAPVVYLDGSTSGATNLIHYSAASTNSLLDGLGIVNAPTTAVRADVDYVYLNNLVVGVDVDGTTGAGSGGDAVVFNGQHGDVRDSVISAGTGAGVRVTTAGSNFAITETYVGTGTDGTGALGNTGGGVIIDGGDNHLIGLSVRDANVIAHNSIDLQVNGTATNITIENNLIGVDLAGAGGAGSVPLEINTSGTVRVGGELSTEANTIRYGTAAGVTVTGTATASILGNAIFSNGGLGIDLGADGVTANDPGDGDTGPNGLLNFPVLTVPEEGDSLLTISLDVPAGDYRIEVFTNPTDGADPSGHGEGETLLATKAVTHTGAGSEDFTIVVPAVSVGQVFTATVTVDLGGSPTVYGATSEFSAAVTVAASKPAVLDSSVRRSDLAAGGGLDPAAAETAGITGRALPFDGFGDRLEGPALNISGSGLTMTARVRPDTLSGTSTLVSKRTSGGSPIYELTVNGAGQASATFGVGGAVTVSGGSIGAGTWHDVVAAWDGVDAVLYVDGVEVDRAAASGSLPADIDTPVAIGNRADGSAGFDGLIDHVDITHDPLTATEVGLRHANTVAGTLTVTVGQQQTAPPGPWTVTTGQSRSGTYALTAPVTVDSGSAAWAVATGIDEPGVVFESWWWITSTVNVDLASGTRAGASATDQFDAAFISASDWALRRRFGATTDTDGTGTLAPSTGTWVKVEQWTDQNGNSRLLVDGTEVITWTGQTAPPASGSVGFRVGELPGGQVWYIDDPRARKLISPEPVATLGPLDRD